MTTIITNEKDFLTFVEKYINNANFYKEFFRHYRTCKEYTFKPPQHQRGPAVYIMNTANGSCNAKGEIVYTPSTTAVEGASCHGGVTRSFSKDHTTYICDFFTRYLDGDKASKMYVDYLYDDKISPWRDVLDETTIYYDEKAVRPICAFHTNVNKSAKHIKLLTNFLIAGRLRSSYRNHMMFKVLVEDYKVEPHEALWLSTWFYSAPKDLNVSGADYYDSSKQQKFVYQIRYISDLPFNWNTGIEVLKNLKNMRSIGVTSWTPNPCNYLWDVPQLEGKLWVPASKNYHDLEKSLKKSLIDLGICVSNNRPYDIEGNIISKWSESNVK